MENNPQPSGSGSPPKPWEKAASSSGPAPFKPPSPGSTSDVVETSGTANPGEIVNSANRNNTTANTNVLARPVPNRPWEQQQQQQTYGSTYGGYGSGLNYNSGYGSGTYGGSYGGYGSSMYGGGSGGLYGNNMYRGGYGGLYGGGMYNGGMYNSGVGGPMGGYGVGAPYGEQDPNNPFGVPSSPPNFWVSLMRVMQGVVTFFGRIAMLIDQNTQAFHLFMTALLQLFDRSGVLYGELAGFVLRLLGVKAKPKKAQHPGAEGLPGPQNPRGGQNFIEGPKAPGPSGTWDSVWGGN
ncbi:unnamed protein product [Cuscuta epithymum]|uniref:Peroxin-13 n=1 Tax=Cuscuta epithymum TaxID=186058 RepID=A0AAV0EGS1_9ASTE|nr:unnamed protein product [Cuscuta epithymum]